MNSLGLEYENFVKDEYNTITLMDVEYRQIHDSNYYINQNGCIYNNITKKHLVVDENKTVKIIINYKRIKLSVKKLINYIWNYEEYKQKYNDVDNDYCIVYKDKKYYRICNSSFFIRNTIIKNGVLNELTAINSNIVKLENGNIRQVNKFTFINNIKRNITFKNGAFNMTNDNKRFIVDLYKIQYKMFFEKNNNESILDEFRVKYNKNKNKNINLEDVD